MYIIQAEAKQIEKIVDMSIRAFETDVNVGGAKGDCPPEFDSVEWHKQMAREGHLYQAMIGNDLVGAAILFPDETEKSVYVDEVKEMETVFGDKSCIDSWMQLVRAVSRTFPGLETEESIMDGTSHLRRIEDPEKWVDLCRLYKDPDKVPEGSVPATQFIFVREEDDKIVGMLQIRHCFNYYLEKFGGHIGYSVAPSERRKGYASQMLKTALPKCKELGIEKVLITCIDNNEGSRKTILVNGGL